MTKNNMMIATVVAVIVVGAAAFFGGMQYQKSQTRQAFADGAAGRGQLGNRAGGTGAGGAARGGAVRGQILSSDNNSITVKMMDGSSKIVLLSGSTTVSEATTGSVQNLQPGKNVMVFGTTNSDGSVTAQNVQVGDGQMMFGNRGQTPAPSGQ